MKKNILNIHFWLCLLLLGGLMSCSEDSDVPDVPDNPQGGEMCSVSVQIGAAGATETRSYGGDEHANEHEFIHSLCVFVVDETSRTIEAKWGIDDASSLVPQENSTEAIANGNLLEWHSTEVDIPAGNKIIYAFANWETVNDTDWNAIIDKAEGATITETELNAIVIEDLASKVDLASADKKYIPMSVKHPFTLSSASQSVRVELVRLVARVNATLTNSRNDAITLSKFTMGTFADQVTLFGDAPTTYSYNTSREITLSDISVGAGTSTNFQFYVNETKGNNTTPFSVSLVAGSDTYNGQLASRSTINRNEILPLALTVGDNTISLQVIAYVAPIGGYPVEIWTNGPTLTTPTYAVTLPEGSSFQVKAFMTGDDIANPTDLGACPLSLPDNVTNSPVQTDDTWGYVTALEGQTGTVVVTMPQQAAVKTANLKVTTKELGDNYPQASTRATDWSAAPRWYIPVALTRNP